MKNINPLWQLLEGQLGINFDRNLRTQKAIKALSHSFTESRGELAVDYLQNDTVRAAYLAYYVPLNYSKMIALFQAHQVPMGTRWCDYGCGPGTATLAALYWESLRRAKSTNLAQSLEPITIYLVDTSTDSLKLASHLVKTFAQQLGIAVQLFTHKGGFPKDQTFDLSLAANVLNELPSGDPLLALWKQTDGVMFVIEPSHRVSSQKLVRFRGRLLNDHGQTLHILGPCTHQEQCPLFRTKHWCHFSEPLEDPIMLELNQRVFRDLRAWLKFSYLLVAKGKPQAWDQTSYRAIGDLHPSGAGFLAIDLCQPKEKKVLRLPSRTPMSITKPLVRGALVKFKTGEKIEKATPLTAGWINRQKRTRIEVPEGD